MNHIVKENVCRILDFMKICPKVYWQYSKSDPCGENSKLTILTSGISIENLCLCYIHQKKIFAIFRNIVSKYDLYSETILLTIHINKKAVCPFRKAVGLLYCLSGNSMRTCHPTAWRGINS